MLNFTFYQLVPTVSLAVLGSLLTTPPTPWTAHNQVKASHLMDLDMLKDI
jgi:hypothetical protein